MSRFITFDGIDGAGKSTQVAKLGSNLIAAGIRIVETREPGGSLLANEIRLRLLDGLYKPMGIDAEAIMFAAARVDHVQTCILPALAEGKWVICDRFVDSGRVYQGLAGATPVLLANLERAASPRMPDLTLILDIDSKIGIERVVRKNVGYDRYESEDFSVQKSRRQRFLEIAHAEPDRCVVIDGSEAENEVARRIFEAVRSRFLPF